MREILHINTIAEVHQYFDLPAPKHPLISLIQINGQDVNIDIEEFKYALGLYQISLKDNCPFTISNYGRNSYDYQEGTMVFTAPNQVLEFNRRNVNKEDTGWSLLFHPDLIRKSSLGENIDHYSFFAYGTHEALHLSEDERKTMSELAQKVKAEYSNTIDAHSQRLIISNLELLLNYCLRYYDRQFFTRTNLNQDYVSQFEQVLKAYYASDKPKELGIPTVHYCAEVMNMSPKYLSDLLRKETGKGSLDHIHEFIIDKAKSILLGSTKSVSEIAFGLGYDYPQYFSKLFKKKTEMTPGEFRKN